MRTEASQIDPSNKNGIDKLLSVLEILALVVVAFPFASMALWILASSFLTGDYFFFFPTAMFTFLPAGIFALMVQMVRISRKRPASSFDRWMFGSSIITVLIGIFACMAIFVVAG